MNFNIKQSALIHLYRVYDTFRHQSAFACKKGCAECCTRNVILTSLETTHMLVWLTSTGETHLLNRISANPGKKRFTPKVTINGLATLCLRGENPPDEHNDPLWGRCPFLHNDICMVYHARPFACRSMGSSVPCKDKGYAELDDFMITVNEVFMQYIEHIDQNGFTGNLMDMLTFLKHPDSRKKYKESILPSPLEGILKNTAMPALMIPPQYREKIRPLLAELNDPRTLPGQSI